MYWRTDLAYARLGHVQLHLSGCVLDGPVDQLQSPHLVPNFIQVLGKEVECPQEGGGRRWLRV